MSGEADFQFQERCAIQSRRLGDVGRPHCQLPTKLRTLELPAGEGKTPPSGLGGMAVWGLGSRLAGLIGTVGWCGRVGLDGALLGLMGRWRLLLSRVSLGLGCSLGLRARSFREIPLLAVPGAAQGLVGWAQWCRGASRGPRLEVAW